MLRQSIINTRLYGILSSNEQGFTFSKFKTSTPTLSSKEAWINLKTGRPLWETDTKKCSKGLKNSENKNFPECSILVNPALFMESSINEKDIALRVAAALFTLGTSLTGATLDVTLNEKTFYLAYNQAISSLNHDILTKIDDLRVSTYSTLNTTQEKYQAAYQIPVIEYQIKDSSGFYQHDFDFNQRINLLPNQLSGIDTQTADSLENMYKKLSKQNAKLRKLWLDQTSYVSVTCDSSSVNHFKVKILCPEKFHLSDVGLVGKVLVDIRTFSINDIAPNIKISDHKLKLDFDGTYIGLSNLTDEFLTIDSVSFYYGNKIAIKNSLNIELSPQGQLTKENKLSIHSFPINRSKLAFSDLTIAKAKKLNPVYGFAIKYRTISDDKIKTLFQKRPYPLLDLIIASNTKS
jgi:hypothetical protein